MPIFTPGTSIFVVERIFSSIWILEIFSIIPELIAHGHSVLRW